MPIALPQELRSRVLTAFDAGLGTMTEIADRFCVSLSSVSRWVRLNCLYGEAKPKPSGGGPPKKMLDQDLDKVREIVDEKPDRTLSEITAVWNERYDQKVGRSSINRALKRAGISFKKRHFVLPNGIQTR
jgi:transposase